MSELKHCISMDCFCVRLSILITFFQGNIKCIPASNVTFSIRPNVVTIPVEPVGTTFIHPKRHTISPSSEYHCLFLKPHSPSESNPKSPNITAQTIMLIISAIIYSPPYGFKLFPKSVAKNNIASCLDNPISSCTSLS